MSESEHGIDREQKLNVLFGVNEPALRDLFAHDEEDRVLEIYEDRTWSRQLMPVWSGGQTDHPDVALVFVNPTYRNQAVQEGWDASLRAPHIGIRRMWSFLASCGVLPQTVPDSLPADFSWEMSTATSLYETASECGLYVTNLVKAVRTNGWLPSKPIAKSWLPLLINELNIVQPSVIITMGGLVTATVAGLKWFRVADAAEYLRKNGTPMRIMAFNSEGWVRITPGIIPSYFPAGRGNPRGAREIISAAWKARDSSHLVSSIERSDTVSAVSARKQRMRSYKAPRVSSPVESERYVTQRENSRLWRELDRK